MKIKEKEREWKKREIINALVDLALEKGIVDISIGEIARKAGFAKSSIYYYFSSKEEIIKEVLIKSWEEMLRHLKKVKINKNDPYNSLIILLKYHLKFIHKYPKISKFLFHFSKSLNDKNLRKLIKQENSIYFQLIKECLKMGVLKGNLTFIYNSLAGSIMEIAKIEHFGPKKKLQLILENLEKFKS
jgi:AcrR family transcriptional regulator